MMRTSRKMFLQASLVVGASAAVAATMGCGGDGDDDMAGGNGGTSACSSTIAANHGHVLTVSQADIDAAAEKTYDIEGSADHPHSVSLSADDFANLASGVTVSVTSSTDDGHSHQVTVTCG